MPPAFNLSQDQTLQFNPKTSQSTDSNAHYFDVSLHPCDCLNTFCNLRRFASRHPHLSVVQIFKDQKLRLKKDVSSKEMELSATCEKPSRPSSELCTAFWTSIPNLKETKALGVNQALCLLVAGAGFEPATFGL